MSPRHILHQYNEELMRSISDAVQPHLFILITGEYISAFSIRAYTDIKMKDIIKEKSIKAIELRRIINHHCER